MSCHVACCCRCRRFRFPNAVFCRGLTPVCFLLLDRIPVPALRAHLSCCPPLARLYRLAFEECIWTSEPQHVLPTPVRPFFNPHSQLPVAPEKKNRTRRHPEMEPPLGGGVPQKHTATQNKNKQPRTAKGSRCARGRWLFFYSWPVVRLESTPGTSKTRFFWLVEAPTVIWRADRSTGVVLGSAWLTYCTLRTLPLRSIDEKKSLD